MQLILGINFFRKSLLTFYHHDLRASTPLLPKSDTLKFHFFI
jgi:hypothetical protein